MTMSLNKKSYYEENGMIYENIIKHSKFNVIDVPGLLFYLQYREFFSFYL